MWRDYIYQYYCYYMWGSTWSYKQNLDHRFLNYKPRDISNLRGRHRTPDCSKWQNCQWWCDVIVKLFRNNYLKNGSVRYLFWTWDVVLVNQELSNPRKQNTQTTHTKENTLNVSKQLLIVPTKCTIFILHTNLLYFSSMLRCHMYHHQGELLCHLFQTR